MLRRIWDVHPVRANRAVTNGIIGSSILVLHSKVKFLFPAAFCPGLSRVFGLIFTNFSCHANDFLANACLDSGRMYLSLTTILFSLHSHHF